MGSTSRVRAVIVDDEPDVRDLLRLRLERSGRFDIVGIGGDSPDAIALCAQHKPDVLVLDALMPSGNGTDIVRDILAVAPSTLVIIYTGDTGTATRDQAEAVGAHAVIGKLDPFDRLVGTVFRLLPDKAPPSDEPDDFERRMTSLLESDATARHRRRWWRSGNRTRIGRVLALVLVLLPLTAAGAWFLATLVGMSMR
jgi:DNA-binding NarL/FixJ family response regulator